MVRNNIIVIPFNLPWEWSTDYTNQTAFVLSKTNIVICYMWSESYSLKEYIKMRRFPKIIKKFSKNIYLFYPLYFIPFRRFRTVHNLNEKLNVFLLKLFTKYLSRKSSSRQKVLWIFDPNNRFVIDIIGKGWKVVYDCVDYFLGAIINEKQQEITLNNEEKLTREADLVTANSRVLLKHLKKFRKKVYLVPQGFRVEDFKKTEFDVPKIDMPHPIIGFAGAVNYRIDYDLMLALAKRNPQWSFVIWGPLLERDKVDPLTWKKMQKLIGLKNVTTGFMKDRKKLPGIFKQFDIAMIPYDITQDFNRYCYPMKLFEFFYLGKPVISTEVEELKRFPDLVKIGKNYLEWERIINNLLSKSWSLSKIKKQRKLSIENSWENKVKAITSHL